MFAPHTGVLDVERGQLADINPDFWQTDTAIGNKSWCYIADEEYKSAESLIGALADIVSKNGTLLLNLGPKTRRHYHRRDRDVLLKIGKWLTVNGEAIYATRPWKVFGEGPTEVPEGHFTDTKGHTFTAGTSASPRAAKTRFTPFASPTQRRSPHPHPRLGNETIFPSNRADQRGRFQPAGQMDTRTAGPAHPIISRPPSDYGVTLKITR